MVVTNIRISDIAKFFKVSERTIYNWFLRFLYERFSWLNRVVNIQSISFSELLAISSKIAQGVSELRQIRWASLSNQSGTGKRYC